MLLILIAIVVAAAISVALLWFSGQGDGIEHLVSVFLGFVMIFVTAISTVAYLLAGWQWFASEHEARIINREYGTHYTREEVFWASNVIDTVRELDRKRIEVNGDVMREAPSKER